MKHWTLIESLLAVVLIGILWALVARAESPPNIVFPPAYTGDYAWQCAPTVAPKSLEEAFAFTSLMRHRFLPGTTFHIEERYSEILVGWVCADEIQCRVVYPDGRAPEAWEILSPLGVAELKRICGE